MSIERHDGLALARLLQLSSASLPIGGYTYSQGIEWAVEAGWIGDREDLRQWLDGLGQTSMARVDLPILERMLSAWYREERTQLEHWSDYLIASRETRELRDEEHNRGRAFYQVLAALEPAAQAWQPLLERTQIAGYAYACQRWHIDFQRAATALLWNWIENLVLAAVKIIPLGQTDGQKLIFELSRSIPDLVAQARATADDEIGAGSVALAIASAQHETQYTRLFRS